MNMKNYIIFLTFKLKKKKHLFHKMSSKEKKCNLHHIYIQVLLYPHPNQTLLWLCIVKLPEIQFFFKNVHKILPSFFYND